MFGRSDKKDEKAEAEARRIEAMKTSIEAALAHLKAHAEAGNTDRCEAAAKRLVETLKNPKLPTDYAKQARGVLDSLLLHGFMKATALAAKGALDAAKTDDIELRSKKIKEAREKLAGAMKYKAPAEFKSQCERLIEVAMLSGGVKQKGPTRIQERQDRRQLQPLVPPQVSHFRQVPLRTSVKLPHSPQASPS
jgi:hypothetical protein